MDWKEAAAYQTFLADLVRVTSETGAYMSGPKLMSGMLRINLILFSKKEVMSSGATTMRAIAGYILPFYATEGQ